MKIKSSFLGLFLFVTIIIQAQPAAMKSDITGTRPHKIDIERLVLDVEFDTKNSKVMGSVTHYFRPLRERIDSIFFDAVDINIKSAKLNGKSLKFKVLKGGVYVYPKPALTWGAKANISFEYEATPRKGLYFVGWNDPKNRSRKQLWTQGQGIDNRHWIPMYDERNDKTITEVKIKFEKGYEVLSNGELISKKEKDGFVHWHYAMKNPHSTYLIMLGIGKYAIKTQKSKRGTLSRLYYYPETPEKYEPTYKYSAEMIDHFEDIIGIKYPWTTYAQIPVQDYMYGAMENTTATIFGDFYHIDERRALDKDYVGVNAHELAHQWFGDYITARGPKDAWLQEGYATYYAKMFKKYKFGEEEYQWMKMNEVQSAFNHSKSDKYPLVHHLAGRRIYPKGSMVLDMMNYVVGEESYKRALTYYLKKNPYANVETSDLYFAFQDTLGMVMDWFFDEWLYKGGEPHYQVSYEALKEDNNAFTRFTVEQIHEMNNEVGLFKMPIIFEVHYTDGSKDTKKVWLEDKKSIIDVINTKEKKIAYTLFDPGLNILKKVTFNKSFEELKSQALAAKNMIDRYDALLALSKYDIAKKQSILVTMLNKETFYGIKAEVAKQLVLGVNSEIYKTIKIAISDKEMAVRKSLIENIKTIPLELKTDFEKLLTDKSYDVVMLTLDKLCDQFPENVARYLNITKTEKGLGLSIRIKWLEQSILNNIEKEKSYQELVNYTSQSYEFRTRQNAINLLSKLNYINEPLINNLFNGVIHYNKRLAKDAISALRKLNTNPINKGLIKKLFKEGQWKNWQKEIIESIIK